MSDRLMISRWPSVGGSKVPGKSAVFIFGHYLSSEIDARWNREKVRESTWRKVVRVWLAVLEGGGGGFFEEQSPVRFEEGMGVEEEDDLFEEAEFGSGGVRGIDVDDVETAPFFGEFF